MVAISTLGTLAALRRRCNLTRACEVESRVEHNNNLLYPQHKNNTKTTPDTRLETTHGMNGSDCCACCQLQLLQPKRDASNLRATTTRATLWQQGGDKNNVTQVKEPLKNFQTDTNCAEQFFVVNRRFLPFLLLLRVCERNRFAAKKWGGGP